MSATPRLQPRGPNARPRKPGTLGHRLTIARQQAGLSLAGLARAAGTNDSHVVKIERGIFRSPRLDTIKAFAEACGVEPAWLAFGVPPMRRRR